MMQRWFIATCILASLSTAVHAQPPGRGWFGSRWRLLVGLDAVRKELGVEDQQAELLDALQLDLAEQRLAIREQDEGPRSADEMTRTGGSPMDVAYRIAV